MDDQLSKAFDFAADLNKQLITLAAGITAFSFTLIKDFLKAGAHRSVFLAVSWALLLISMISGLMSLGALTGVLAATPAKDLEGSLLYQKNVSGPAAVQVWTFLAGVLFLAGFAYRSLPAKLGPDTPPSGNARKHPRRRGR